MTLRLSRRIPGLLLAALVVYFFATNSEVVWLYALTALLLAMIPIGLLGPAIAARRLRIRSHRLSRHGFVPPLAQDRGKVFVGDLVRLRLVWAGNPEASAVVSVRLADGEEVACWNGEDGDANVLMSFSRRGAVKIRALQVATSWPLGVLEVRRWLPVHVDFVVHPGYVLPPSGTRAGATEPSGESSFRGVGEEFVGLREYQPGDSQRRVHWPTTARAGTLMVIETAIKSRSPAQYRVVLSPTATSTAIELAATVAASLAAGTVASGRPFRLVLPGPGPASTRWRDALANLAVMEPSAGPASATDATVIAAEEDGIVVETTRGSWRLAAGATLDDVAATLGRTPGEGR